MKLIALIAPLLAFSSPAFAIGKLQFDVSLRLKYCALNSDNVTCYDTDPSSDQIHETVEADPSKQYPNQATFEKTYHLKGLYGNDADVRVKVNFYQYPQFGDNDYTLSASIVPASIPENTEPAANHYFGVTAADLSGLGVGGEGEVVYHTMDNGTKMATTPGVNIFKIKVLP